MLSHKVNVFFVLSIFIVSACSNIKSQAPLQSDALGSSNESQLSSSSEQEQTETNLNPDFELLPDCFVTPDEYALHAQTVKDDVWTTIRNGYQLEHGNHKRTRAELAWYTRHPDYIKRVTKRAERYMFHITQEIEKRGIPMEIALLPIVESAFDPFAYSHGRASGMWQIVPGTGRMLGLKQNWWYDGRRDVVASTNAALNYLERQHKRFKGDWLLALASYNSGAGNVSKAIRKNKKRGKPTDYWSLDLPKETKAYVPRLLALAKIFSDPSAHNVTLTPIASTPYFASVPVGSQIDLAQAADLAGIDMDALYHLNPGFNRWATDPKGPHELLIPVAYADTFRENLAKIPENERVTWERYKIRSGDSLSTIAKRYKISVSSLRNINKLRNNNIRAGRTLMVPVAAKPGQHYSYSFEERVAKRHASVNKTEKGKKIDYVVKAGDSLWDISRKYGVSVAKLARWNSMAPRDPIKPGQKLKIWSKKASASAVNTSSSNVIRKVSYKVRSGDSLARIANKFQLKINDILKWNKLQRSKYLQPGQLLTLFIDVKRSHGI